MPPKGHKYLKWKLISDGYNIFSLVQNLQNFFLLNRFQRDTREEEKQILSRSSRLQAHIFHCTHVVGVTFYIRVVGPTVMRQSLEKKIFFQNIFFFFVKDTWSGVWTLALCVCYTTCRVREPGEFLNWDIIIYLVLSMQGFTLEIFDYFFSSLDDLIHSACKDNFIIMCLFEI